MSLILKLAERILTNGDVAFYSFYLSKVTKIVNNFLEMDNKINELMIHQLRPEAEKVIADFVSETMVILSAICPFFKDKNPYVIIQDEERINREIDKIKLFASKMKLDMVHENFDLKRDFISLKQYVEKNSNMDVSLNTTVKRGGDYSWYLDKFFGLFQLPSTKKSQLQLKN